jgi:hypothetical protein
MRNSPISLIEMRNGAAAKKTAAREAGGGADAICHRVPIHLHRRPSTQTTTADHHGDGRKIERACRNKRFHDFEINSYPRGRFNAIHYKGALKICQLYSEYVSNIGDSPQIRHQGAGNGEVEE